PVVGPAAGLHHHLGGRLLGEERFHLLALEVALQDGAFPLIHAMECEDVLGGIDGNALKFHGTVLGWWFDNPTLALDAVGPSTSTTAVTFDASAAPYRYGQAWPWAAGLAVVGEGSFPYYHGRRSSWPGA